MCGLCGFPSSPEMLEAGPPGSGRLPTATMDFDIHAHTHFHVCTPHTCMWRCKREEMYMMLLITSSRTEEAWPISSSWLPHGGSPLWLRVLHFCLLNLTPTALAPHSSHVEKAGLGSWLLPPLPSASHSAVYLLTSSSLPKLLFLTPLKITAH